MTSEELKNAAVSVLEKPYHTQLYLILKVGDELIMRLADIEDENTAPEIQRMFVGFVNNTIISNDNIIIRSLSVADELPNAIYEYDYESYPEELGVFKKFSIETAKVALKLGFNPQLAHKIYAGADMFLMPSQTEPCGLAQMVALRYGTVPIVRETGGLNDTVSDSGDGDGNGFTFKNYNAHDMENTVWRALAGYDDKAGWDILRKRGMRCDNSWGVSANAYIRLYKELAGK